MNNLKLVAVLLLSTVTINSYADGLYDIYVSVGYGDQDNLYLEIGEISEGFSVFGGFAMNLDDQRKGESGDASFTHFRDVNKISEGEQDLFSFYMGPNYTIKHANMRHTFGLGLDTVFIQKYTNWYDSDQIFGDEGKFYLTGDNTYKFGGILKYSLTYSKFLIGVSYRTYAKETALNIGFKF